MDWPKDGPRVLWRVPCGAGYSGLSVAAGRLYTVLQDGDHEAVLCLDAESGKEHWRFRYPTHFTNNVGDGPRSTPAIDGGRVYAVGATGVFHCLDTATGSVHWRHDLLEEFAAPNVTWGVSFSPLVEGDLVYTNPGGRSGGSLAAFDKTSGKLAWKALDDPAGYSSPVATTLAGVRQIVFCTARRLVGVGPDDGRLLWEFPWQTNHDANIATPICRGDYVFISSGYGRGCGLVKVEAAGGGLRALRVYEHTRMSNHFATSVLYGEHLYGFHEALLTCLDFRTGQVAWRERGFEKGSLLVADGHLIVLGEQGKLAVAPASPAGYKEKASVQVSKLRCWVVPTLANGRLYVRDEQQIVCLDLRKQP